MGYANDSLGATPTVLSPAQFKAYLASKAAATAPAPTVKVQVTAPSTVNPILSLLARRIPAAAVLQPRTAPAPVPVPVPTAAPTAGPTTAQNAAPLVAAAVTPVVGPIAAAIPTVIDAAAEPSPVRIRIAPAATPALTSPSSAPSSGGGSSGPELYNADGSPVNAAAVAATAPGNLLDTVKSLPPAVLAAVLVGGLFILSQRRR